MMNEIKIQSVTNIKIGHAHDPHAATGCTVLLSEQGVVAGVDVRGGAPGTRETDVLHSQNLVDKVHAVFLSGGSAYGLDVGTGIMKYLEEKEIGLDVQVAKVPIVTGSVLFDLQIGKSKVRPDQAMGYRACEHAYQSFNSDEGNVGAGMGATVGKCLGPNYSMKGGLGAYAVQIGDLKIGAIMAVNSFGDVVDADNNIIAGVYDRKQQSFLHTEKQMLSELEHKSKSNRFFGNTTIGSIITNARLTKAQANKVSSMAHDGIARATRPSHTMVDGDTIFTMSTNEVEVDLNTVGLLAADVVAGAIVRGVKKATELCDIPSC